MIDTGRPVATVGRELGIHEQTLGQWVNAYRVRQASGDGALSETERAELLRPRKDNADLGLDWAFLKLWRDPEYVETVAYALCLTRIEQKISNNHMVSSTASRASSTRRVLDSDCEFCQLGHGRGLVPLARDRRGCRSESPPGTCGQAQNAIVAMSLLTGRGAWRRCGEVRAESRPSS